MHGKQYLQPTISPPADDVLHDQLGHRPRCIESLHPRMEPLKVGVIGLGTGTLATYGSKGDVYRFYDINPAVIDIAQRDFTYLGDSDATIETRAGRRAADARARAAAELRRARDRRLLERRDPRAPDHHRSARDLPEAHEAGRRHRVPRHQPVPRPRAGRRRRSPTRTACTRVWIARRRRRRAREPQRLGAAVATDPEALRRPAHRRSRDGRSARTATGGCGPTTSTTWCRC